MATRLTPLSKALITLVILALVGFAVWELFLKQGIRSPVVGPLGSEDNPIKVSIVSFHGYAPALVANGKSLTTQPGSVFEEEGVYVEFLIQDNIPTLAETFGSETAHCSWRTSDFWAQEHPNLRNAGYDARAVVVVDNTQGADAIIARDSEIRSIEDLAGHSVALLEFTPSHGMFIDALENSSLTRRKRESIEEIFVKAEEGTPGVRATFESGQADAAVLWDPDLSLAIQATGAHVIYSTKTATNLIYDVMVCDTRYLDDPENEKAFQAFVKGWMEGVGLAEQRHDEAVSALVESEPLFALLAGQESEGFIKSIFGNIDWTNLADNVRILGLAGTTNHYERVYRDFDGIYRRLGALADPNSPVINPQESFDYRFIRNLMNEDPSAIAIALQPTQEFTAIGREEATTSKEPELTKPVHISFATNSSELTRRAMELIDNEMKPQIESMGSAYFTLSGNTDSTGTAAINKPLSRKRAQAVVDYLVTEWEFSRERFNVVGNGSEKPLCNERNPDADGLSLEECRELNRTVRLAIFSSRS